MHIEIPEIILDLDICEPCIIKHLHSQLLAPASPQPGTIFEKQAHWHTVEQADGVLEYCLRHPYIIRRVAMSIHIHHGEDSVWFQHLVYC